MRKLKACLSKILFELRIPSEREIRDLQQRQIRLAQLQEECTEKGKTKIQLDCDQKYSETEIPVNLEKEKDRLAILDQQKSDVFIHLTENEDT